MSESRIKLMKRLARIFESVSSVKSAIIGDSDNEKSVEAVATVSITDCYR